MLLCTQRDYIEKNIWDEKIFQWYTTQKSDTQCSAALLGQTLCHLTWTGSNWFLLSQFLLDIIVTGDILRDANDDQPNDDQDSEFTVNAVACGKIFHYVTMSGHTYVPEIEFSQILFLFKLFKMIQNLSFMFYFLCKFKNSLSPLDQKTQWNDCNNNNYDTKFVEATS